MTASPSQFGPRRRMYSTGSLRTDSLTRSRQLVHNSLMKRGLPGCPHDGQPDGPPWGILLAHIRPQLAGVFLGCEHQFDIEMGGLLTDPSHIIPRVAVMIGIGGFLEHLEAEPFRRASK